MMQENEQIGFLGIRETRRATRFTQGDEEPEGRDRMNEERDREKENDHEEGEHRCRRCSDRNRFPLA